MAVVEVKETETVESSSKKKTTTTKKTTKKVEKKAMLKVTLVKSSSGRLEKQKRTLVALGLSKVNSSNVVPDNEATRGMIFVVKHLVKVENV